MREGERTRGVWLPIALADIAGLLYAVCRRAGGDSGEIKLPRRSELLRAWMLPAMAAAIGEDEAEEEALSMLKSVRSLKNRDEQKHAPV